MPEPAAKMWFKRRVACLVVLTVAGCGGSSGDDLFSSASGGGAGGAGHLDASSGGVPTSAAGGQGPSGAGGSASGGAAGAFGTGGTFSAGGAPSAGGAAGATAGGGMSGAGTGGSLGAGGDGAGGTSIGGAASTVACDATACDVASQETCCFGDGVTPHCAAGDLGGKCTCSGILCTSITVACDGPEDCTGGQLCCGEEGLTDPVYTHLYCRPDCIGGLTNPRTEICHPGGAACTNGKACATDTLLPTGFSDCG